MRSKLPYILVAALIVGYVLLETLAPKPHDWGVGLGSHETKPFGTKLLHDRLGDLFPGKQIRDEQKAPAKVLAEFEPTKSNYIIVAQELEIGGQDARALLDFARRGNNVFVAAETMEGAFADSLHAENKVAFYNRTDEFKQEATAGNSLSFTDASGLSSAKHYPLIDYIHYNHFDFIPNADVLSANKDGNSVFVRVPVGEGHVYLHSVPFMFTNYYMVDPVSHDYISKALSFLPVADVIWDEHFKPGRVDLESSVSYLLDSAALRWAWILLLVTLLIYIVFEGKRRQRAIPVLEPPVNTTLDFTNTISRLYLGHADHKDIAEKKIKYFLDYCRTRWMLGTQEIDGQFELRLSAKSGVANQDVRELCTMIRGVQSVKAIDGYALMSLNRKIESFYVNSQ